MNGGPGHTTLQQTLSRSLTLVAMLAVIASLLAVAASGAILLRGYAQENLDLVAHQAAYSVEVAVVFDDRRAVAEAIAPIMRFDGVRSIEVRNSANQLMASEQSDSGMVPPAFVHLFDPDPVTVPIRTSGQTIGRVTIHGRTTGIDRLLIVSLLGAIAAFVIAQATTRLAGQRLRRTLVQPLHAIANAADSIGADRMARVRAPRSDIAEIDNLSRNFNRLLDQLGNWQEQVEDAHLALLRRANHDPLSGLPNRASFIESVRDAIRSAQRNGDRFALLFLDGDQFKLTNDRYGHAAGDAVITEVARRIPPLLRVGDVAARLGGDEFAVLIHHLDELDDADAVAARIDTAMAVPITLASGHEVRVGMSIGVAIFPQDGTDVDALIAQADRAMYVAKQKRKEGMKK
jgi:diguanylate cyclase (GGDEF)-like protein